MVREGCRHPEVSVQLSSGDGGAGVIIGRVSGALRRAGHADEISDFTQQAMDGDYDHVLRTCMEWVDVT